jgi:hypothetical protein
LTAWPHGDAVHRKFAVLRHEHGRQILDTHARSAGNDDDVGISMKRFDDDVAIVANQTGEIEHASVALDERREHRPVRVGNVETRAAASRRVVVRCLSPPNVPSAGGPRTPLPGRSS